VAQSGGTWYLQDFRFGSNEWYITDVLALEPPNEIDWFIKSAGTQTTLFIMGTDDDDQITVTRDGTNTVLITTAQTMQWAESFDFIEVHGLGGNDTLVSVSGAAETLFGGEGIDIFCGDSLDTFSDVENLYSIDMTKGSGQTETAHYIEEFFQPTNDPDEYVSLELLGQDIVDPVASQAYGDFSSYPLFVDRPTYDDAIQGNTPDCYLLAALGSLAETDPRAISQMITPLGDGTYAVRFIRNGEENFVRVDAELPAYYGIYPANANLTPDDELWVALTEKAYAQFRYGQNSYASIGYGWMDNVYREITGMPTTRMYVSSMSEDDIVTAISEALWIRHPVSLGTLSSASYPIVGGHAYVVKSIENASGEWEITVYNVWGQDGYTWDDNSSDGLLIITLDILKANFSAICISNV
jgi:hypothetical protein